MFVAVGAWRLEERGESPEERRKSPEERKKGPEERVKSPEERGKSPEERTEISNISSHHQSQSPNSPSALFENWS